MNFEHFFGNAKWIGTGNDADMPMILHRFTAKKGEPARITALGFGVFIIYVNGVRAHREEYLPLNTDFDERDYPVGEITAHRAYPESFDISGLLKDGENILAVALGNGWYNKPIWEEDRGYGNKKLCYRIEIGEGVESREILSSPEETVYALSPVTENHFNKGESQDLRIGYGCLTGQCEVLPTVEEKPLKTEYLTTDCPRDVMMEELAPLCLYSKEGVRIYDFGKNTVGYPTVRVFGKEGEEVLIDFSEELEGEDISKEQCHEQHFNVICSGTEQEVRPLFGWMAARYARVMGPAEITSFSVVHAEVRRDSDFSCSDPTLNYLYNTFINTQLTNMHGGTPSDCPHLERRGYTGDGQLVCRAAMATVDSERFYRKWLYDISDCQDRLSGNVQYTAPYTLAGGGPGGWGSAIVTVPHEFYLRYGRTDALEQMYDGMQKYLGYLDDHTEFGLVTSTQKGIWCLGDWVTPTQVAVPPSYVNTYFYVKSCQRMIEIARIIGREEDIPDLEGRIEYRKHALCTVFMDDHFDNFLGNVQGANAFALDIGLGTEKTKRNFISYYEQLGHYDTGIFGTELVTRMLFELDRADIAVKLLTAAEPYGFGRFMKLGATTLWEYWGKARSHNHPMFGAVVSHLFEYVLGIRQNGISGGYTDITVKPVALKALDRAKGYITVRGEKLAVDYRVEGDTVTLRIDLPKGTLGRLVLPSGEYTLAEGENEITARIAE